ncbi:MAG: hypothetical protein NW206_11185 [Hyphomonadaceae bacterium]|nr:hypothetical protein [Hyphomonadaceae bacterium]
MSLNKTLDRLFDEIRREAKRNPDFADRLDAVLRLHESRRDVPDEVVEEVASSPASGGSVAREAHDDGGVSAAPSVGSADTGAVKPVKTPRRMLELLNPVGLYKREGEEALATTLAKTNLETLRALIAEHNLDPSGETGALDRDALAAHVVAQAKRRAERDEKLFDY